MTSRRDFLKKAGLISAAFAVPALNVNGNTTQSKIRLKNTKIAVDDRWDVIVIGGGPAGERHRQAGRILVPRRIGRLRRAHPLQREGRGGLRVRQVQGPFGGRGVPHRAELLRLDDERRFPALHQEGHHRNPDAR